MITKCSTNQPLDFGASDPSTFRVCTFLVNVLSHMYEQWMDAHSPIPPTGKFDWQPANACPVTTDFKVSDYDFGSLIWSTFNYTDVHGIEQQATEPFGSLVRAKADGSLYLVFRGSKSDADFRVDLKKNPVRYDPPNYYPPNDVLVEEGWYAVYNGLVEQLRVIFKAIRSQKLTITGHSLGSALATLAVPFAVANYCHVRHYNSASPMVGIETFRTYYETLKESSPESLEETFRLVNTADSVPNFPDNPKGYVHVGTEIAFNAVYTDVIGKPDEKKIHDPCCSYAYAIYNPAKPCNPNYDSCAK